VIQGRDSNAYRLNGVKVYLNTTPYSTEIDESNLIATLVGTTEEQIITLNPTKSGTYLLIKGEQNSNDNSHLHLRKVEVYGTVPATPAFKETETSLLISNATTIGTKVTSTKAIDYQDDILSYTILDDVPFSINNNGDILVNADLNETSYSFDVMVSDGVHSIIQSITRSQ